MLTPGVVALLVGVNARLVGAVSNAAYLASFSVVDRSLRLDFANDATAIRNLVDFL
jgi:hypothetical protein